MVNSSEHFKKCNSESLKKDPLFNITLLLYCEYAVDSALHSSNSIMFSFKCVLKYALMKNLIIFVFPLEENCKSSHRRCSARKGILRKFSKFTGKHSNTGVRCFPVNFGKFLRTLFLQNTSGRVLLKLILLPTRLKRPISNCS